MLCLRKEHHIREQEFGCERIGLIFQPLIIEAVAIFAGDGKISFNDCFRTQIVLVLQAKMPNLGSCPRTWCSLDDHGSSQRGRMSVSLLLAG